MNPSSAVISPRYKAEVWFALAVQLFIGLLAMLLLDGGRMARVMGVAALGFWLATALIVIRRPQTPTGLDLAWIRWGFGPIAFVAAGVEFGL